jgi:hypothetical protein
MSDEQSATTTDEQAGQQQSTQGGQSGSYTPPASQADLDRIIADRLSRERAKFADYDTLKSQADKLAEIEAAQLTESEKAAARLAELEAEVAGYKTQQQVAAWKAEVEKTTGVPAAALAGSSLEEIQAHAETLKSLITPAPRGPIVPTEGNRPTGDRPDQLTRADVERMTPSEINRARSEGRLDDLMGIKR